MSRHRSDRSPALVVVLVALVVAACSSDKDPGVRVDTVQADIVFGAEKPEAKEAPLVPAEQRDGETTDGELRVPFRNKLPDRFSDVDFTVDPDDLKKECPSAPLGEAPDNPAPDRPKTPPLEGLYKIKKSGTRTVTTTGFGTFETKIVGFDPRIVRGVDKRSSTHWTWESVEKPPVGEFTRVIRWSTNLSEVQRRASTPYVGENPVRVSAPDAGVTLTRITDYDGNGNIIDEFAPSSPLLYLPLPVLPGEQFNSVGVSPRTGQTVQVSGEVLRREAVDACGTRIDGWLVRLQIADSASGTHTEDVIISTDFGGLMISQRLKQTYTQGSSTTDLDVTYTLGQIRPTKVPDEA